MDKNKDNVAVSALYTAATWQWARLPCAEVVTPANAARVFRYVNLWMRLYRWINPAAYSLPHQLLHRHTAIDHLLAAEKTVRVIEVACGFSPRGAYFSADPGHRYTEIDLPDMVAVKRRQLESTPAGQAILARANLDLVAGDITALDWDACIAAQPAVVITEGLMMYFPRTPQLAIWRDLASALRPAGGVYLFDYIPLSEETPRSRVGAWLHALRLKLVGKGDFAYDERDRDAIAADLQECGFDRVEHHSTRDVARAWGLPLAGTPSHTLIYVCRVNPGLA